MTYKKGDRITASCAPKIWMTQHKALYPHASVTVDLTGETEAEIAAELDRMDAVLRQQVLRALTVEIEFLNAAYAVMGGAEDTAEVYAWAKKEIEHAAEGPTFQKDSGTGIAQGKVGDAGDKVAHLFKPYPSPSAGGVLAKGGIAKLGAKKAPAKVDVVKATGGKAVLFGGPGSLKAPSIEG